MTKILERTIEQNVVKWVKDHGILMTKMNLLGRRGWPDRVLWLPTGRPLFVEFKRPGGELTKLQIMTQKQLRELGYEVQTHDNVEAAKAAITATIAVRSAACQAVAAAHVPAQGRQVAAGTRRGRDVARPGNG